ncbi:MAG: hypothetical protein ACI9HK_003946, partial [Pirellulaceae bacterium]
EFHDEFLFCSSGCRCGLDALKANSVPIRVALMHP